MSLALRLTVGLLGLIATVTNSIFGKDTEKCTTIAFFQDPDTHILHCKYFPMLTFVSLVFVITQAHLLAWMISAYMGHSSYKIATAGFVKNMSFYYDILHLTMSLLMRYS